MDRTHERFLTQNSQIDLKCAACVATEFEFDDTKADGEPTPDEHVQGIGEDFAQTLSANLHEAIKKLGFGK